MVAMEPKEKLDARGNLGLMVPKFRPIDRVTQETNDVVTLSIRPDDQAPELARFKPGQFNMLYAFGIGEVPISISGDPAAMDQIVHTIRAVGPVSDALSKLEHNALVGIRGPFGSSWPVEEAAGGDVLVVAGGIGLAPLRPALYHLIAERERYGRVAFLYGARSPDDLLYRPEIEIWKQRPDLQVRVTVDRAGEDWTGDVGVVTMLLPKLNVRPATTIAMVCGPEVMIRFTAAALENLGVAPERIFVSLERNMKCAVGSCGHCQFGPHFVCKDGPIFRFDQVKHIMSIRET
jgi:NAD(P)H-flavin reductase